MKDEAESTLTYEEFYESIFETATDEKTGKELELGPPPKKLLGDIWHEGDMAVLFGETAIGKSVFATQIGDSLARGKGFGPFEVEGGPRKVLYLDLKLSGRKWLMRYTEDDDNVGPGETRRRYKFPKTFERIGIRTETQAPKGFENFTLPFARALRQLVKEKKPRVLIFDSISRLKHSNDVTRDVLPVMRVLSRLKRELNLSILVLVQSQQHQWSGSLAMSDLRGLGAVCNVADSIFAIGSGRVPGERYIKQLRSYASERLYDESHVPVFDIEKPDGESFVGFTFSHYAREATARRSLRDLDRCPVMDEAKALKDKGMSIRMIAKVLGVGKTSVQRMLQQWTLQPRSEPGAIATGFLADKDPEVGGDPGDEIEYGDEELGRILKEIETDEVGHDDERDDVNEPPERETHWVIENAQLKFVELEPGSPLRNGLKPLTRTHDHNGREIWVEEFNERGQFKVWYAIESNGKLSRCTRDWNGIGCEKVKPDSS